MFCVKCVLIGKSPGKLINRIDHIVYVDKRSCKNVDVVEMYGMFMSMCNLKSIDMYFFILPVNLIHINVSSRF